MILDRIDAVAKEIRKAAEARVLESLLPWLSSVDISSSHNRLRRLKEEGTGRWFLTSEEFEAWKTSPASSLWLHGVCKLREYTCSNTADILSWLRKIGSQVWNQSWESLLHTANTMS